MSEQSYWRKCVVCKSEIPFSHKYYKCSVTSCDKKRSPAQFCSVECWDVHRSIMGHKSAGADEYHSPSKLKWLEQEASEPKVRVVRNPSPSAATSVTKDISNDEILVVASKFKAFVKEYSDLNTSAEVMATLSDILREHAVKACENAKNDGRKTLMSRDFK